MAVEPLNIFCYYDTQRFTQFGSMDCANWYNVGVPEAKRGQALYPAMGRQHIQDSMDNNQLIFNSEPRQVFKTLNYMYVILQTNVIQVDSNNAQKLIGDVPLGKNVWFAYLPVGNQVFVMLACENELFLITETGDNVTLQPITDPLAPTQPSYVAAFGNRFVVSQANTPQFYLTAIGSVNPATCFTNASPQFGPQVATASGVIGQFAVLHNQLYIFCSYTTDVWANIQSQLPNGQTFPWKQNTSYNFDYGISDPFSLDTDFGMMTWLAQNQNGLVSFMMSNGGQPMDISSQAINVLIEGSINSRGLSPFIQGDANGFLYQYENTIFYHVSAGNYVGYGQLDVGNGAYALEYNFDTKTWCRVIELNGERNRIQKHVYFNNMHMVTIQNDGAMYEMAGNIYHNEERTPDTASDAPNAFTLYPFRYELVTQQIFQPDYSEFLTDYVEIDFVFGFMTFYKSMAPFLNTIFIIDEAPAPDGSPLYLIDEHAAPDGQPIFIVAEDGNTPAFDDNHYYALFKPHIELYYSDDGGVTFITADLREFSQLGQYRWRMRWYELGASRNRCYKLVCISSAPIVILGAVQDVRRSSGGAN